MTENQTQPESQDEGAAVSSKMLTILFAGFAVIIVGIILLVLSSVLNSSSGSVGGVIFIGPFPIVFGTGQDATWLIVISLVIAVIMLVLLFVWRRRS
jgi:uncharacterized membrane protein